MKTRLFALLCFFVCTASAQAFDRARLDQYLETLEANDKAMLSLAIVKNGKPVYQKATGVAHAGEEQNATIHTQYRIGSITKVFTATMIFQLIDEEALSLDTTLATFYPEVKNAGDITVAMLLSHRSGIHNFTDTPDYRDYMTQAKSRSEMIKLIESLGSDFSPGSQAKYSNSGYVLLGFIIEAITQDTYASQLKKRITRPLNLANTGYGRAMDDSNTAARSYTYQDQQWSPAPVTDLSIPGGAGAVVSTPTDVAIFLSALLNGKLTSGASLTKMREMNQGFGHGLLQFPFYDKVAYGHNGGIDGFQSMSAVIDGDDVAFAVTANGMNYSINEISVAVLSMYYGRPYELPDFDQSAISLSVEDLSQYEGVYSSQQLPLNITMRVKEGQLTAQATGQQPIPLTPYSAREFRFEPAGIVILFDDYDDGIDHSAFTLKQAGGSYPFSRE
ncbi:serine hydrolase domain-containing protein [Alteromonas halophila]|uniref:D-Ala-D-Ala carboxypeptidase n=1 Tax=Alteromonas halophila TaxID=516698 RepID=A0A918N0R7_9ALTE|nr:serine hydrolase domain-containing protein [Alteromonas halophila]GGW90995.1 D-Ala-D-Ala carboxypeptidase [Alteromonas halophila]